MGRAGRPQYDDHGVAVVLVHDQKKHFYKSFLYEPFPVESRSETWGRRQLGGAAGWYVALDSVLALSQGVKESVLAVTCSIVPSRT